MTTFGPVHGLVFSGGKLYFTSERARLVGRYDPATAAVDWVIGTGQTRTHLAVISADAQLIATSNIGSGTTTIFENVEVAGRGRGGAAAPPTRDWTATTIPAGRGTEGIDLSPDGKTLWVSNVPDKTISVVDVASKKVTDTISLPTTYSNRLKFTRDARHVLVGDYRGTEMLVIDAATHAIGSHIVVGGGTEGMLMSPDGSRAFVSSGPQNKVLVIDLKTFTVAGEIPGLQGPDAIAWVERH
jgi:YVTN family beta-propeller protein